MALGIYEEEDIRGIAKSIRNNLGNDTKYTVGQMPSAINEIQTYAYNSGHSEGYGEGRNDGYEEGKTDGLAEGKKSQYDEFWDSYQDNGKYKSYLYAFAGGGWNDRNYNPKYPIRLNLNAQLMYAYSVITDTKVDVDFSIIKSNTGNAFSNSTYLKTIRKIITGNNTNIGWHILFIGCVGLENLIIEGEILTSYTVNFQECTKLTHASLMSIINALKDNSGTTTWNTITLGADNIAKLTQEELDIMEQKQWEYT